LTGTANVSHVYRSSGTFDIVGTVTDSFGNVVRNSISVSVNPKPQPVVSITATTPNPIAGVDMTFTASIAPVAGNGTVIQSASVNFDDGTTTALGAVTGTSIALHHVYAESRTYTVTLTATDSNGGVGTAVTTVFVQAAAPLGVSISFTRTVVDASNTLATFTATVTGLGNAVVTKYLWDFGDGSPTQETTTNQATHNYTKPSPPRVVTVTVFTSSGGSATGTTTITP